MLNDTDERTWKMENGMAWFWYFDEASNNNNNNNHKKLTYLDTKLIFAF